MAIVTVDDNTHLWAEFPVELDGWVLAHRMLMTDQQKIKDLLAALQAQTEATVLTTAAQRAALDAFYKLWTKSVYHHHDSEENILFPYLSMKDVIVAPKVAADHKTLHTAMDACAVMVDKLTAVGTTNSPEEEAQILRDLLNEFSDLDEMLVGHFYEEENTLIGALRKAITPKEQMKHIGKPIGGSMSWAERGQFFSKLSPDTLKVFIKQEGMPFFVKWIFQSNIKKYNRVYVGPVERAIAYSKASIIAPVAAA